MADPPDPELRAGPDPTRYGRWNETTGHPVSGGSYWNNTYVTWGQRTYPPGAGWSDDWQWWYQYADSAQANWDITALVVEARWTTDQYTLGDGTFRGDLQPGRLELRVWDTKGLFRGLSKRGQIWACYTPTGAAWAWHIDEITQLLAPPGAPGYFDLVITGNTWPSQLSTISYGTFPRAAESANARLAWAIGAIAGDRNLVLAPTTAALAADPHVVPATAQSNGLNPSWLQIMRDAASNGVLWWEWVPGVPGTYPGSVVIHYDLWDTVRARPLDPAQVVAGSPWEQGNTNAITQAQWAGTRSDGTTKDTLSTLGSFWGALGLFAIGPMRIWGDISAAGAQRAAVDATNTAIFNAYGQPDPAYVDSIQMVSGDRSAVQGGATTTPWDPAAMVYRPTDRLDWARVAGQPTEAYSVVSTSYVLNARSWSADHTLARYVAPTHLP